MAALSFSWGAPADVRRRPPRRTRSTRHRTCASSWSGTPSCGGAHYAERKASAWIGTAKVRSNSSGDNPAVPFRDLADELLTAGSRFPGDRDRDGPARCRAARGLLQDRPGSVGPLPPGRGVARRTSARSRHRTGRPIPPAGSFRRYSGLAPEGIGDRQIDTKGQPMSKAGAGSQLDQVVTSANVAQGCSTPSWPASAKARSSSAAQGRLHRGRPLGRASLDHAATGNGYMLPRHRRHGGHPRPGRGDRARALSSP